MVLLWTDLTGGSPFDVVDPTQIMGLHWFFDRVEWGSTITPPYPVDVWIGTVALVE